MEKLAAKWPPTFLNLDTAFEALQRNPDWGAESHFVAFGCKCCNPFAWFLLRNCVAKMIALQMEGWRICTASCKAICVTKPRLENGAWLDGARQHEY